MQTRLQMMQHCYITMIAHILMAQAQHSANDGEPCIVDKADLPENKVRLIEASGKTTKLKHFAPSEGIKMLGLHKAATLQENTDFEYIQAKA
eukprot:130340-Ditylum_brightwellii.AAC.1